MNKQASIISKSTILLISMILPLHASAQTTIGADDKSVTGAVCVPGLNTSYSDVDIRASFIKNLAGGYRWVACSIPIDSEGQWALADSNGGTDNGSASIRIGVEYGSTSGDTKCTAQIVSLSNGAILETGAGMVAAGTPGTHYTLTIPSLKLGSANNNALGINCLLTPGSKLQVINLEEYADTHQKTVHP